MPFAADPLLDVAVDALDEISAGAFLGSLVAVLVLVASRCCCWARCRPGRSGWRSTAWSTRARSPAASTRSRPPGSLFGTLVSALLLIPLVGTRRTFLLFAFAIALVACGAAAGAPLRAGAGGDLVLLIALPVGTLKASDDGKVIHEAETPYQYARVVERDDGSRRLELNEGQARHSLYEPGQRSHRRLLGRPPGAPVRRARSRRRRIAILGNAAGTTSRAYEEYFPETEIDGVEIDAELSEIGRGSST